MSQRIDQSSERDGEFLFAERTGDLARGAGVVDAPYRQYDEAANHQYSRHLAAAKRPPAAC